MRIEASRRRASLYDELMQTHSNNDKLFYKLVAAQRSSSRSHGTSIMVDDRLLTDEADITDAWADHFELLGRPLEDDSFDNNYFLQVLDDIKTIHYLSSCTTPSKFSTDEVTTAIKRLNSNRAADPQGLMAEHLKHAPAIVCTFITDLFNATSATSYIPSEMSCGDIITIPKKGKDPLLMNNYRGITITSVLGKVLEHVAVARIRSVLRKSQHPLQYGFTTKLSPSMAALVCTEVLANNKDISRNTFIATIDVQKAFDSVWHDFVLRKLYISTSGDSTWSVLAALMRSLRIRVRMNTRRSREVTLQQGVGQGRIPSTEEYKLHLDRLLNILQASGVGSHIGPFFLWLPNLCGRRHAADSSVDLQTQLSIVSLYSQKERYIVNPTKTTISVYGTTMTSETSTSASWNLGPTEITPTEHYTHLGIKRKAGKLSPDELVSHRIDLARRTRYCLMGAGLHGSNGISPTVAWSMYRTYVLPRLTYNMEILQLTATQISKIEQFHRSTLRDIQGLPARSSSAVTYLLLGALPFEASLHIQTLHLIGKIANDKDSLLHQIALRQLSVKDTSSQSWFIQCLRISSKYDLPSLHEVFDGSISPA